MAAKMSFGAFMWVMAAALQGASLERRPERLFGAVCLTQDDACATFKESSGKRR